MLQITAIPGVTKFENVITKLKTHATKKYESRPLTDVTGVALHQAMAKNQTAYDYANYHINVHDWPGIGYDFVIERDGTLRWCNYLEYKNYHIGDTNRKYLGVCFSGDFRVVNGAHVQLPTEAQLTTCYYLLKWLFEQKTALPNLKDIIGHNEAPGYAWKECPGFDMNEFRSNYSAFIAKLNTPAFVSSAHFADVPKEAWYAAECEYMYGLGLLNGTGEDKATGKRILGVGDKVEVERLAVLQARSIRYLLKRIEALEEKLK